MKRVLLCQDVHPEGRRVLEGKTEVLVAPDPREEPIRAMIAGFHGVIVRSATTLGPETIDAATSLQVIGRTGVGVDNIDVEAASRRGIPVCYTPDANSSSVVEHVLALILSLAKRLPLMDRAVRKGRFRAATSIGRSTSPTKRPASLAWEGSEAKWQDDAFPRSE